MVLMGCWDPVVQQDLQISGYNYNEFIIVPSGLLQHYARTEMATNNESDFCKLTQTKYVETHICSYGNRKRSQMNKDNIGRHQEKWK